jgi:superfamily II DNA or RNA helicase
MGRKDRRHDLADILLKAIRNRSHASAHELDGKRSEAAHTALGQIAAAETAHGNAARMTVADWRQRFKLNLEMFPENRRTTRSIDVSGFKVGEIYSDGTVVGSYETAQDSYLIFCGMQRPPAGCSCPDSDGEYACEHCYGFTNLVIEQLGCDSDLSNRLRRREFAGTTPDRQDFRYDHTCKALSELKRIAVSVEDVIKVDLPRIDSSRRERLAWGIQERVGRMVRIVPLIQPQNKRGDGWNRGRETTADGIRSNVERTQADTAALEVYSGDSHYTPGSIDHVVKTLQRLVGQSNVIYNGEPIEVAMGAAVLRLVENSKGWHVKQLSEPGQTEVDLKFCRDGLLNFDLSIPRVYVIPATTNQLRCVQALCGLPAVSRPHQVKLLFEQCQRLQNVISIVMPESHGRVIDSPAKPVMLLASRPDGYVNYGLRVRTGTGRLQMPAAGPVYCVATVENETVQLKRSFADEQRTVHELQRMLELPEGELTGRITFEHGLRVVELLEHELNHVEVLWDQDGPPTIRSLGTISNKNVRVDIKQKRDWFQLDGVCELGGESIKLSDLMSTLADGGKAAPDGWVRIGDQGFAKISEELRDGLKKLADSVNHERGQMKFDRTAAQAMREIGGQLEIRSTKSWQECLNRLAVAETLEPTVPATLHAELRDYQLAGFKWMRRLAEWGVGGVLADDMGLGKTVQTLAVLVDRAEHGPALVIAPTSVGFNWMREIARFAPHVQAHSYRETDRSDFLNELGPGQIVVCSYGLALRDAEKLAQVAWSSLILDEAQAIKNSNSKTSQAIASIPADWTLALTGTPVENHLGELWSLFRVVSPGLFGGWEHFRSRFATPIERDNDDARRQALRERLKPFVLRRTKREVLQDLPARTESNLVVELSPAERKIYDSVRLSVVGEASQIAKLSDSKDQRFKLLALLTRLRQIACHPRLVDERWTERSTKSLQLLETLQQLCSEGHRALIFSQFVQHLKLIREMLDAEGISYQYLDGATSPADRQAEVDRFQNGDASAFLISLKAGGTGLNLTAADYVIHMDPWWNPAVEDQATDRAHRIGQTKPVMVYRLIAKSTIEEEILRLHDDKRDLVAGILDGTHAASNLSTKELIELLTRQA